MAKSNPAAKPPARILQIQRRSRALPSEQYGDREKSEQQRYVLSQYEIGDEWRRHQGQRQQVFVRASEGPQKQNHAQ